jgi:hypothetical protein
MSDGLTSQAGNGESLRRSRRSLENALLPIAGEVSPLLGLDISKLNPPQERIMADIQKFRDELRQLRKSIGGDASKAACDAYWNCLANCSTTLCSDRCCTSYPDCCGTGVNAKVKELIAKHFGAGT